MLMLGNYSLPDRPACQAHQGAYTPTIEAYTPTILSEKRKTGRRDSFRVVSADNCFMLNYKYLCILKPTVTRLYCVRSEKPQYEVLAASPAEPDLGVV